jgi:pimeloyl-ACP methyl ester carboxylesterase
MILKKVALILASLLLLTSCAATELEPLASLSQYETQELKWRDCYSNYQCSSLLVPINYSDLSVGAFSLALLRYQALDQDRRIGSLVVNPGGPGSSGVDYAYNAEYIVSPEILERFDIVGFDPRGVGQSAAIKCLSDAETDASFAADPKPDDEAEFALFISDARDYFAKCTENTKYLTEYSTLNSARDLEILRAVLGDEKLNFLGKSYGTYLGTLYAELFPEKVGRFVLDGAVDPNSDNREAMIGQAVGFESALNAFISNCLKRNSCALTGDLSSARNQVLDLLAKTAITPLESKSGRKVTEGLVLLGIASALYDSDSGWPVLRDAFSESILGSGESFLKLADQYAGRQENGSYLTNENDALQVIDCLDQKTLETVLSFKNGTKVFLEKAPIFGPYLAYAGLACRYLPNLNSVEKVEVKKLETSPILIIGTTRDPATPYKWARSLAKIFSGSVLLTLDGDGHTGHGRGSTCIDSVVDRYLLTGSTPKSELLCAE